MVDPDTPEPAVHTDAEHARAGETPGVTRYVLAISLTLVVVLLIAVLWWGVAPFHK